MKNKSLIYPGVKVGGPGPGCLRACGGSLCRLHCGAEVFVSDNQTGTDAFSPRKANFSLRQMLKWEAGGHSLGVFESGRAASGQPWCGPWSPLFKKLQRDGVRIVGEFAVAAGLINVPVVAITGTNGKTTVTTLDRRYLGRPPAKECLSAEISAHRCMNICCIRRSTISSSPKCPAFNLKLPGILLQMSGCCSISPRTIWTGMVRWRNMCRPKCSFLPISNREMWQLSMAMIRSVAILPRGCRRLFELLAQTDAMLSGSR